MASISSLRPLAARFAARAASAAAALAAVCAAVLALAPPAAAGGHAVLIEQYAYAPAALTIEQGDTVTWTNHDSVQHDVTITSGPTSFHSPMLAQGQSWTYTFATAGSYSYICSVHPDMRASVTVTPRATAAPKPAAPAPKAAAPAAPKGTPTSTPATAGSTTKKAAKRVAAAPPAAQVAAPAATQEAIPAVTGTESLSPLLLVAGASTAVMVFCLLLMTSRPVTRPAADQELVREPVEDPLD